MIKNPTPENKYLYSKFRNHVVSEQCKSKSMSSIVNMNSKTQFSPISHLMDNRTQINDPVKMANIFNN